MKKTILKYFSTIFIILLIIKLIDVFKNLLVASKLGVSDSADIFMGLISIPDSLIVLVGIDSMKGVINSEFTSMHSLNKDFIVWDLFNKLCNFIFWTSIIFTLLIIFTRTYIIDIILPGFSGIKKEIALSIALIIFPMFFLKSLTGIFHASLNSLKKFYFPVIINIIPTIFVIISIFLPYINENMIYNLSFAVLLGNIMIFIFSFFRIVQLGGYFKFDFLFFNTDTVKILKSCGNIILLLFFEQVYNISRNFFASYFGEGAISSLNYARTIPLALMGLIFATIFSVLLTNLSQLLSLEIRKKVKDLFTDVLLGLLFITIPIIIILLLNDKEFLTVLYLRGKYTMSGLEMTLLPFRWEVISMLSFILYMIPTALYLAKKEYKKLNRIGSIVFIAGILSNFIFVKLFGFYGVSISYFIVCGIYGVLLIYNTRKYFGKYSIEVKTFFKIIISGVITYLLSYFLKIQLNLQHTYELKINFLIITISAIFIIVVYVLITNFMKVNYLKNLVNVVLK